jgi:Domain of unknown function (DUF4328)
MSSTIDTYRSPKLLSYLALAPLGTILAINILNIILGFCEIVAPSTVLLSSGTEASRWLALIYLLYLVEVVVRVCAAIFFLVWLFRTFKNLAPLKVRNSEHPPGWAVGFWFVPFANLFKPHQIMQQAWRDTDPDVDPALNYIPAKAQFNNLILGWWITYIVSVILLRFIPVIVNEMSNSQRALVIMIASILVASAAGMAFLIVSEITGRQIKRAENILNVHHFGVPPVPPDFG